MAVVGLMLLQATAILRVPTPTDDGDFYAAIALALARGEEGIPSVMEYSPQRINHVPFYGPVYFRLAALSLSCFGVGTLAVRMVSLLSVWAAALFGGMGAAWLSGSRRRGVLAALLLLLTPELNAANVASTMHPTAVACLLLALAGMCAVPRGWGWRVAGTLAGVGLAGAALTTPRAYPALGAFALAGLVVPGTPSMIRRAWALGLAMGVAGLVGWMCWAHGGPFPWWQGMWTIASREERDVALLAGAVRVWAPSGAALVTALVALPAVAVVARAISAIGQAAAIEHRTAAFLVAWTFISLVATVVTTSYTGAFRIYSVLPLFAAVLAVPVGSLGIERPARWLLVIFVMAAAGSGGVRWLRLLATWERRDPAPLGAFVAAHVPAGSAVVGPGAPYLVPIERTGSRYFLWQPESPADWAKVVAPESPPATPPAPDWEDRYLIWPADAARPEAFGCGRLVARFEPAPHRLEWLGPFRHTTDEGIGPALLFRLPPGCPAGYDPTGGAG